MYVCVYAHRQSPLNNGAKQNHFPCLKINVSVTTESESDDTINTTTTTVTDDSTTSGYLLFQNELSYFGNDHLHIQSDADHATGMTNLAMI